MPVTRDIFRAGTLDDHVHQFAAALPQGRVWQSKLVAGSNLNALISSVALPFYTLAQLVETASVEFDANTTDQLIEKWETSVGLPDTCIGPVSDLQERRDLVISRLSRETIVTLAELQAFVDGIVGPGIVTLRPGREVYTFEYDFELDFFGAADEKFILVAEIASQEPSFEYNFEIEFIGGVNVSSLLCSLRKVLPGNAIVTIRELPNA